MSDERLREAERRFRGESTRGAYVAYVHAWERGGRLGLYPMALWLEVQELGGWASRDPRRNPRERDVLASGSYVNAGGPSRAFARDHNARSVLLARHNASESVLHGLPLPEGDMVVWKWVAYRLGDRWATPARKARWPEVVKLSSWRTWAAGPAPPKPSFPGMAVSDRTPARVLWVPEGEWDAREASTGEVVRRRA